MKPFVILLVIAVLAVAHIQAQEPIGFNEPVEDNMTRREYEFTYTFTGKEGQVILVDFYQTDVSGDLENPILILTGPDGEVVGDTSEAFTFGSVILVSQLPESGNYVLTVTRQDGETGRSNGDFSVEVINVEPLSVGEKQTVETDSNSRSQYYFVLSETDFKLAYLKQRGDFDPEIKVNVIDEDTSGLNDVAAVHGAEMEDFVMGSFDAETLYIIEIGQALFDFNFQRVTAEFDLTVMEN